MAEYLGSRVPAYPLNVKVPTVEVFAWHVRRRFLNSHVLWTRSRHRLSHRSHSLCESRHCRIQSSIRRLLSDILHPRIDFLKLTSQQVGKKGEKGKEGKEGERRERRGKKVKEGQEGQKGQKGQKDKRDKRDTRDKGTKGTKGTKRTKRTKRKKKDTKGSATNAMWTRVTLAIFS